MIDRDRLRDAMSRNGFSQAELARRSGVSPAAIQQILNGKVKRSRALPDIAEALSVNAEWLEGRVDSPSRYVIDRLEEGADDLVAIPFFFRGSTPNYPEHPEAKLFTFRVSRWWLESLQPDTDLGSLLMQRVTQKGMAPTINPGDDILVSATKVFDGDPDAIWLLSFGDHSAIRRVRPGAAGKLLIVADNPGFPDREVDKADVDVVGRIIWHGRLLLP